MNNQEYKDKFPSDGNDIEKTIAFRALEQALETRKFEIELYWKRATYFWAFIAVTFAAFGLVQRKGVVDSEFLSFLLANLGFILSFGWFLANRGSKYWQENWEHHVDHLEDNIIGPLFKTSLPRRAPQDRLEKIETLLVGPSAHSVSKINQIISLYICIVWLALIFRAGGGICFTAWTLSHALVAIATVLSIAAMLYFGRTWRGNYGHTMETRESTISESPES